MKKLLASVAMLATLVAPALAGSNLPHGYAPKAPVTCAVVVKSSDGFWAVRETPNSKMLFKLHAGDTVQVQQTVGKWAYFEFDSDEGAGWVHTNGLQQYPCGN